MNIILKSLTWLLDYFFFFKVCLLCSLGCWILNLLWKKKLLFLCFIKVYLFFLIILFFCCLTFVKLCLWAEVTLQSQSYLMTLIWQRNHKKINCTEFFFKTIFLWTFFSFLFFFSWTMLPFKCTKMEILVLILIWNHRLQSNRKKLKDLTLGKTMS